MHNTNILPHQHLVAEIHQLSPCYKKDILTLYQEISHQSQPLAVSDFCQTINHFCHIHHHQGMIVGCFGCGFAKTEHLIKWDDVCSASNQHHKPVYAWCIWDAFFICQILLKPASIVSEDLISQKQIHIRFDGSHFVRQSLFFSFPKTSDLQTEDLRSCFCCRTKVFECIHHANEFAKQNQCEVVDWDEMLRRTQQMVAALTG